MRCNPEELSRSSSPYGGVRPVRGSKEVHVHLISGNVPGMGSTSTTTSAGLPSIWMALNPVGQNYSRLELLILASSFTAHLEYHGIEQVADIIFNFFDLFVSSFTQEHWTKTMQMRNPEC